MKRTVFIIIALLLFMTGSVFARTKTHDKYSLDEVKTGYPVDIPIDDEREAIEYAKENMPFEEALSVFNNLKEKHELISGWIVMATLKNPEEDISLYTKQYENGFYKEEQYNKLVQKVRNRGEYWKVIFFSQGMLPSYQWTVTFSPNGDIFFNEHMWNK